MEAREGRRVHGPAGEEVVSQGQVLPAWSRLRWKVRGAGEGSFGVQSNASGDMSGAFQAGEFVLAFEWE